ncbi:DUF1751-domain-containing protein [Xylona heveae TC161]|uniref:DUF1751-domain-containing protein n=1 Tax=Xylona heveae (strain CBS 132557 / TC161) TaxID=1328760 RepID=A0A165A575_XYLHT|nr:DUF1751-domain-containing protein [Xylona heveae TC161]KZF19965.1 DUF1751-domain-containing protein [Xylona heveae TC161]
MPTRINIPPLTRGLLLLLICLSLLSAALRYRESASRSDGSPPSSILVPYLTVVPQLSWFYPWVFLIATLVEENIFTLLVTGTTLLYGGKYLERAWGSREFAKFLLVISLAPNLCACAIYIIWFAITGNINRSLTTICGGVSLQAAFLVAFKQLVPEHTVTIAKGLIKIRVKHFPALFVLLNTLSGIILGTDSALILAWSGFLASWTYLRFYRLSPSLSSTSTGEGLYLRGDASETFAFARFFPDAIQGPIATFSEAVFQALVALRICTPFSAEHIDAGNEQALARSEGGLPSLLGNSRTATRAGGKREEAERRRALALRALDQRLHAAAAAREQQANATPTAALPDQSPVMEPREDRNKGVEQEA